MNGFASYYIYVGIFFFMLMISDIIFYTTGQNCYYNLTEVSLYIILIILNIFISILLFTTGVITNYFASMDQDELRSLGFCSRILGIICKILPIVSKILHSIKIILVLILNFMVFFKTFTPNDINTTIDNYVKQYNDINKASINSTNYIDINSVTLIDCKKEKNINSFISQMIVYQSIEAISTFITSYLLCILKSMIDINTFSYEPIDMNANKFKTLILRTIGP